MLKESARTPRPAPSDARRMARVIRAPERGHQHGGIALLRKRQGPNSGAPHAPLDRFKGTAAAQVEVFSHAICFRPCRQARCDLTLVLKPDHRTRAAATKNEGSEHNVIRAMIARQGASRDALRVDAVSDPLSRGSRGKVPVRNHHLRSWPPAGHSRGSSPAQSVHWSSYPILRTGISATPPGR